jgi:hypothetical protein
MVGVIGVCYDYAEPANYPGHPLEILNYNPLDPEPRPDGWQYCYIDANCPQLGSLNSQECVYPQVNGRGDCAVNVGGVISYSGQSCTFDDECTEFSLGTEYCEIQPATDFIDQADCTALPHTCADGYYCAAQMPTNYTAYPYALDYVHIDNNANFLKIDNALLGENRVSFPIDIQLQNNALPLSDFYDPDNPDADVKTNAF